MMAADQLPFGLPASAVSELCEVFSRHPAIEQALLYGSRAKGNYRPGSDIDLCLYAPAMSLVEVLRIGAEIDELLLPWKVDLTLRHHLDNPALIEHIERVGRIFWKSG